MRFDDSLETVLSAEMSTPFGAQSTWRQLVDLIGRGRAEPSAHAIARLRMIRADVPPPVRASSARALAAANPPAALVALLATDEIAVAAPVLRAVALSAGEWTELLPALSPAARSVLRHRRDLPPAVTRALESFGSVDFVLGAPDVAAAEPYVEDRTPEPVPPIAIDWTEVVGDAVLPDPVVAPMPGAAAFATPVVDAPALAKPVAPALAEPALPETIVPISPFVSIARVAAGLPLVAEARRQAEREAAPMPLSEPATGPFQIADLVARIDAYQRQREESPPARLTLETQPELFAHEPAPAQTFRFETDAAGVLRWIEGAARAPLIGLSLDLAPSVTGSGVDGVAAGAFRRRSGFVDARLVVAGASEAAGPWRITGIPVFDRASGRFTGYRGTARRPRADESAEPARGVHPAAEALRQLVHELRTPTNAIAGFAEMIEQQILGPVPAAYRAHAAAIRQQIGGLLGAIDDIDMAARIETHALELRAGDVPVAPLLVRILADLAPLAALRGATLDAQVADDGLAIGGDDRAVERLIARLMATLVASGSAGERIGAVATRDIGSDGGTVAIVFDRPRALAAVPEEALLTIDAEAEAERAEEGGAAPLLGTGFALRLARNLATELRGSLAIGDKTLTLRLPAAFPAAMEQVS